MYNRLMNEEGGFTYWLKTYKDMLFVQEANDEAYKFWRDTVRKRIKDLEKQELLAPMNPPHRTYPTEQYLSKALADRSSFSMGH